MFISFTNMRIYSLFMQHLAYFLNFDALIFVQHIIVSICNILHNIRFVCYIVNIT